MSPISLFRANDPYEQLIQQMLLIEREPQNRLRTQKQTQDRLKSVMKDVDSNLSALHTILKRFTDTLTNPFDAKAATVADDAGFSISAGSKAAYGSHSIEVLRLAKSDTRLSRQFTAAGTDLQAFFATNGAQTFSIEVAHPTESDPANRVAIDLTVDPTGTTDKEILDEIRAAIGSAMDAAVEAGTIKREEAAAASVVNETTSTARLTLKSGQTGYTNRLSFTDSAGGLLAMLEINAGVVASGTGGGQVASIGTSEMDSELNSVFVLNGLTIYRDSNTVGDALTDVTINLKEAGTGPREFNVDADQNGIKSEIEDFIAKYNAIIVHLNAKSQVDGDSGIRGDLAGDSTFRSLRFSMRNDIAAPVVGQPTDGPQFLSDLGIEIQEDGTLKLADSDALLAAVKKDADAVENIFSGDDGIAARLRTRIEQFVGTNGILNGRIESIDTRIRRLNDQIKSWDDKLVRREESLRMQFARIQEAIAALQGQQQSFNMFFA